VKWPVEVLIDPPDGGKTSGERDVRQLTRESLDLVVGGRQGGLLRTSPSRSFVRSRWFRGGSAPFRVGSGRGHSSSPGPSDGAFRSILVGPGDSSWRARL